MSTDDTTPPEGARASEVADTASTPTVQGRREAVREKAQLVHAQQSRARVIRRSALIAGTVAAVAVVAVVVGGAIGAAAGRPQLSPGGADKDGFVVTAISGLAGESVTSPDDASTPTATPEGQASATPEPTASAAAPVQIDVYVDYLSSAARDWQLANATQLSSWVTQGAVTLVYHPVSMLTAKSNGTKYSLRAASAAACVATYAPASFFGFNNDLLTRQPAVDSDGFTDSQLADIALANGGGDDPKKLRECIETEAFASWVKAATERAVSGIDGGDGLALAGTWLIAVNFQPYVGDMTDPAEFSQFVLTTASGKAAKNAAASPTPSPSASTTAP